MMPIVALVLYLCLKAWNIIESLFEFQLPLHANTNFFGGDIILTTRQRHWSNTLNALNYYASIWQNGSTQRVSYGLAFKRAALFKPVRLRAFR